MLGLGLNIGWVVMGLVQIGIVVSSLCPSPSPMGVGDNGTCAQQAWDQDTMGLLHNRTGTIKDGPHLVMTHLHTTFSLKIFSSSKLIRLVCFLTLKTTTKNSDYFG